MVHFPASHIWLPGMSKTMNRARNPESSTPLPPEIRIHPQNWKCRFGQNHQNRPLEKGAFSRFSRWYYPFYSTIPIYSLDSSLEISQAHGSKWWDLWLGKIAWNRFGKDRMGIKLMGAPSCKLTCGKPRNPDHGPGETLDYQHQFTLGYLDQTLVSCLVCLKKIVGYPRGSFTLCESNSLLLNILIIIIEIQ